MHADSTTGRCVTRAQFGALAERPSTGTIAVFCSTVGSAGPAAQGREDVAEEGPDERDVGDQDGDGGFAEVPVHVDVGDQAGDETVDFGEDGGHNDEDSHAENHQQNHFLLQRYAHFQEQGDGDDQHGDVSGDGEAALDDFVVLIGRALV